MRKALSALGRAVAVLVCLCAAPAAAAEIVPTVTAISAGTHDGRVRLMFEVAPEPAFALFTLADPDRLVIDVPALDWQAADPNPGELPYVKAVRHGLFRRDRARIVLDLARPLRIERAFTLAPHGNGPGRLVIDLAPATRSEFDATAGAPEEARWKRGAPPVPPRAADDAADEVLVAIDPGHGGIDPGAEVEGLTEKVVVLRFAKLLAAAIDATPGFRAYLTRTDDVYVPLAERVDLAHRADAGLFVSIHADVLAEGHASGLSAYTLSESGTDDAAEALAERENRSDILAGADLGGAADDLTRLLVELAQRGTQVESGKLAHAVLASVATESEILHTHPLRRANFRVLKAPDIPSVLLEIGFLDDPDDRRRLTDPDWLESTANAIARGIAGWRKIASPGFVARR